MIRNDQRVRSLVHCAAGVLSRVDAFYHDGPVPRLANPWEITPSHHGLLERSGDIGVRHRSFSRDHDILEFHQSAVREKSREPARLCKKLIHKWQHRWEFAAKKFLNAIAEVAFPETRHRRIDRDNKSRKACLARAFDSCYGTITPADQIQLIPNRPFGCGCNILKAATRKRRQRAGDTGTAGCARGRFFAARIHEPTASNRREDQRHGERNAKHGGAQIAHWCCDRTTRPQCYRLERAAVRAQRPFALCAAVDVVKHDARKSALRRPSQIFDVQNAWRLNRSRHPSHQRGRLVPKVADAGEYHRHVALVSGRDYFFVTN